MVRYLAWARAQTWYAQLLRGLPIMGVDGTLADIQRSSPARGKVFAKTGTDGSDNYLNDGGVHEKGLAGYIDDALRPARRVRVLQRGDERPARRRYGPRRRRDSRRHGRGDLREPVARLALRERSVDRRAHQL